ncbi:MAG: tetratricopeptide repeat protein, partial [Azoarcus sp.]|nr:tetratricopeptide repeat protein [Azoarcus sp.]
KRLLDRADKARIKKDYAAAGALFEETVTLLPSAHQGWFGLGEVALGIGQTDTAATFLGHAVQLQPENARYRQRLGELLCNLGQTEDGLAHLLAARRLAPRDAHVLCGLSGGYVKAGHWQKARGVLQDVIRLPRPRAEHYCLFGLACQRLGEIDEALAAFRKATVLAPRYPDAWLSLGHLYLQKKQHDKARACVEKLFALAYSSPDLSDLAGEIAMTRGDNREAANFFRQAIEQTADSASDETRSLAQAKLAIALVMCGDAIPAIDAMERAHAFGLPEDWILEKLGAMFAIKHRSALARENLEMAVARNPDNLSAWNTLIVLYAGAGESEKVRKAADTILAKEPDNTYALMNLATWYNDQGRHEEALALLARVRGIDPDARSSYSKALWTMLGASSIGAADILALARAMDERVFRPLRRQDDFADRDRDPARRLRIGWLSSDMRHHPVSAFVLPCLRHFDHGALEIFIYYNASEEDRITQQCKEHADTWRVVIDIGDEALANLIRDDEIDILIDLNGFTDGCRTDAIARKPAPIQAAWLGFPGTSGMSAMDYIIVPPDPVLEKGDWCAETPWPLPDCYGVRADISTTAIEPGLPCERLQAPFTFACLNHFRKASAKTIELWSRILAQTPEARLVVSALGGKDDTTVEYFRRQFERHGAAAGQLEVRGYVPVAQYFESYNGIDLGLDPFPFNGGTTGYDSIWMGVPFVTWPGEHLSARMGRAILNAVGLRELVADSAEAYVDIAVRLAHDHERLKALRAGLRERMLASPLLDAPRMARNLQTAFRDMWRRWCAGKAN